MSAGRRTHRWEMLIKPIKHKSLTGTVFSFRFGPFFPLWPDSQFTTHFSFDVFFLRLLRGCFHCLRVLHSFLMLQSYATVSVPRTSSLPDVPIIFPSSAYHLLSAASFDVHDSRTRIHIYDGRWSDNVRSYTFIEFILGNCVGLCTCAWVGVYCRAFHTLSQPHHWIPGL